MSKNEKDEKSLEETKNAICKAKENLEKLSEDEHERYLAGLREKYIRDQYSIEAYGYDRGKEEGKNEEKIAIAKKMLEQKADIEFIKKCTGLSEEEIDSLRK